MPFMLEQTLNVLFYIDLILLVLSAIVTVVTEKEYKIQKILMYIWVVVTFVMAILVSILN